MLSVVGYMKVHVVADRLPFLIFRWPFAELTGICANDALHNLAHAHVRATCQQVTRKAHLYELHVITLFSSWKIRAGPMSSQPLHSHLACGDDRLSWLAAL